MDKVFQKYTGFPILKYASKKDIEKEIRDLATKGIIPKDSKN